MEKTNQQEKAEYYHELGETLAKTKKFSQAETSYRKATELKSNWFKPYYSLGLLLEKQGKTEQAFDFYQQSININPNFAWSHFYLGNLYDKKGLLKETIKCYQRAIEVHPPENSYWFHLQLGDALMKQGKPHLAIHSYNQANKVNPRNPQGKLKLGLALTQKQKWPQAIKAFREAIQLQPDFHPAYFELGDAFSQIGDRAQALIAYQKALELKPNDAKYDQRIQECLVQRSDSEDRELLKCYQMLQGETQEPKVYLELGKIFIKRGLVEEAVKAYLKLLETQPTFIPVYEHLRHATFYLKNLDELITTYRQIIKQNRHFLPAYMNLGHILTQKGQIHQALDCYQKAVYRKSLAKAPEFVKKHWDDRQPRLPNFIVIGAQRCGSTSLHKYIIEHPQVLEPITKEINFFTQEFERGLSWYEAHFPSIPEGSAYITGEASTSYLDSDNDTPHRLFNLYPHVKLLVILRNPVERAISHYNQLVKLGRENRSLEEALKTEMEILEGIEDIWSVRQQYWSVGKGYIWRGLYVYFLKQWMSVFPRERFLIVRSENLFKHPWVTMKRVFEFLEVSDYQLPSYPKHNSGGSYLIQLDKSFQSRLNQFFHLHNHQLTDFLTAK